MTSNKNTLVASEPLNWKDGAMILLAVLTFGMGWVADNTEAVISWLAVLIVYLLGKAFSAWGKKIGKFWLTIFLFAVAVGLSLLMKPLAFPAIPEWSGDIASYLPVLISFLYAVLQTVDLVITQATIIYNVLLAKVLEKLPSTLIGSSVLVIPLLMLILIVSFVAI